MHAATVSTSRHRTAHVGAVSVVYAPYPTTVVVKSFTLFKHAVVVFIKISLAVFYWLIFIYRAVS